VISTCNPGFVVSGSISPLPYVFVKGLDRPAPK
jgi:hypothetical protein